MSLIVFESCDLQNDTYANSNVGTKWFINDPAGITTNTTKDGRVCWALNLRRTSIMVKDLTSTQEDDVIFVGARVYASSSFDGGAGIEHQDLEFYSDGSGATTQAMFERRAAGKLALISGASTYVSSTGAYIPDTWQYWEVKYKCHDTAGEIIVNIDEVEVWRSTGIDTRNGGTDNFIDRVAFGCLRSAGWWVRDIVIMNEQSTDFNGFLGPVTIEAVLPSSDGTTGWTPNSGSTSYLTVDESAPDADTTYIQSTSTGNRASFGFPTFTNIVGNPLAVGMHSVARYQDAPLNVASYLVRGGTTSVGTYSNPTGTYGQHDYQIWIDDPVTSTDWTIGNLNNTEFGVKT